MGSRKELGRRQPTGDTRNIGTMKPYVSPIFYLGGQDGKTDIQINEKLQTFTEVISWLALLGSGYIGHEVGGMGGTAAGFCVGLILKMASMHFLEER